MIIGKNIMNQEAHPVLGFDCPYCGYQYKLAGLALLDKRVKCGSCESKFTVRSEMATVSVSKSFTTRKRDTVLDF